jgi:hypothetical protein
VGDQVVDLQNSSGKIFRLTVVGIFDDVYEWAQTDYIPSAAFAENLAEIEFADYGVMDQKSGKVSGFHHYFPLRVETTITKDGREQYTISARGNFVFNFKGQFDSLSEAEEAGKKAFTERFATYHSNDPESLDGFTIVNAIQK